MKNMWEGLPGTPRNRSHVWYARISLPLFSPLPCSFFVCLLICLFFPQRVPRDQRRAQVRDVGDRDAAFPADGEEHGLLLGGYGRRECRTSAVRYARRFECLGANRAFSFAGALLPLASLLMHT